MLYMITKTPLSLVRIISPEKSALLLVPCFHVKIQKLSSSTQFFVTSVSFAQSHKQNNILDVCSPLFAFALFSVFLKGEVKLTSLPPIACIHHHPICAIFCLKFLFCPVFSIFLIMNFLPSVPKIHASTFL